MIDELIKEWNEYIRDPDVANNPNPPLGVVFSFEGFWLWLLMKRKQEL